MRADRVRVDGLQVAVLARHQGEAVGPAEVSDQVGLSVGAVHCRLHHHLRLAALQPARLPHKVVPHAVRESSPGRARNIVTARTTGTTWIAVPYPGKIEKQRNREIHISIFSI